jgi:hypothetical protein
MLFEPGRTPPESTVKHTSTLLALLSALVASACASGGSAFDNFNTPAAYEGPGCYDHKNRIERTVRSKAECDLLTWNWKP